MSLCLIQKIMHRIRIAMMLEDAAGCWSSWSLSWALKRCSTPANSLASRRTPALAACNWRVHFGCICREEGAFPILFTIFEHEKLHTHTNTPWVTSLNLNHNKTPWGSRKLVEIGQEQSRSVLEGPAPATGLTTQLCCFAITVNIATIWASTFKHGCHYRLLFVAITVDVIVSP